MSIVSSGRVYIYFSWSRSLARTGDEGKSCTSTFVAAKTLPRYLSFRENFANGGVQNISFVGSTSEVCNPQPVCNLQNLCPVPP